MKHRRLSLNLLRFRANRGILIAAGCLLALLILVLALRPEPQLRNSAEIATLRERGVLRVGVRQDMPGFSGDGAGLEVELAQRFADDLLGAGGENLALTPVDSRTAGPHIDNGDVDAVLALQVRGEYSRYEYSRAYYVDDACFAVLPGREDASLAGMRVGTVQTSVLHTRLKSRLEEQPEYAAGQTAYASYPDMLAALAKGEIDAALLPGAYALRYGEEGSFTLHAQVFGQLEYALMCSTDAPALAQLFSLLLDQLEQNGTLLELYRQYNLQ